MGMALCGLPCGSASWHGHWLGTGHCSSLAQCRLAGVSVGWSLAVRRLDSAAVGDFGVYFAVCFMLVVSWTLWG